MQKREYRNVGVLQRNKSGKVKLKTNEALYSNLYEHLKMATLKAPIAEAHNDVRNEILSQKIGRDMVIIEYSSIPFNSYTP